MSEPRSKQAFSEEEFSLLYLVTMNMLAAGLAEQTLPQGNDGKFFVGTVKKGR